MFLSDLYLDWALNILNSALACDNQAITNLVESRVICNEALANHPCILARNKNNGHYDIGILGIINGMIGVDEKTGYGHITAVYDEEEKIVLRFEKTDHRKIKRWKDAN